MFGYIYGNNGDLEYKREEIIDDNEIFIIDNDIAKHVAEETIADADADVEAEAESESDLKNKYFKCWKDSVESEKKKREDCCSYMGCGYGYIHEEAIEEGEGEEEEDDDCECDDDKINFNDTDETDCENKVYIISMNNIPYFYDDNLQTIRNTMWDIANSLIKNSTDNNSVRSNYIMTNNSNEIKIISPYNFFWFFNYNHTISELKIDYVIKYPAKQEKQD